MTGDVSHLILSGLVVDVAGQDLFVAAEPDASRQLSRAIEERLPLVADRLLLDGASLATLSADGSAARKAHAAGAWGVLAALLERGDPMPCKPRLLLDYALRAGHSGLARSCLRHMGAPEAWEKAGKNVIFMYGFSAKMLDFKGL